MTIIIHINMKKLFKKHKLIIIIALAVIIMSIPLFFTGSKANVGADEMLGANYEDAKWVVMNKFTGWETDSDATKIADGSSPNGQNVIINNGDRLSIRDFGYEILGTATTTDDAITSLHTFRRRDGENVLMRSYSTYLQYYNETGDIWESLRTTSTDEAIYGYTDYNINTDLQSYVYFGNAADNFARWTGAYSTLSQAAALGTSTLHVVTTEDMWATGTIHFCDVDMVYTGTTTSTITLESLTTVACASGRGVTQGVEEYPSNPKGNIYLNSFNRLWIAGTTSTPQAVFASERGDPETFINEAYTLDTASDACAFNLGEGGGGVTGMVMDEGALYIFKKAIVYKVAENSEFLYNIQPLKPFDGRSQTTGSVTPRSVFVGNNGIYYITPDKNIMSLQRVTDVDYPQLVPISHSIQETVDDINFDAVSGISFGSYSFFTVKSDSDVSVNDSILLFNEELQVWETPIIGWSASDFVVYDDGDSEELYFGSAQTANVYKVTDGALDNELDVLASWRTKQFNFGMPQGLKEVTDLYIEGYITDNTKLEISLLLDEEGYTQLFTTEFTGIETDYLYNATPYNAFGLHPFGYMRFGSSDEIGMKKFRFYLSKDFRALPFYNAQLEFLSDGENQSWEITNYGFKVREYSQPEKRSLYRSFK